LSGEEQQRWKAFCYKRISAQKEAYLARINELKQQQGVDISLLQALDDYLSQKLKTLVL
jgi:exonuclease I